MNATIEGQQETIDAQAAQIDALVTAVQTLNASLQTLLSGVSFATTAAVVSDAETTVPCSTINALTTATPVLSTLDIGSSSSVGAASSEPHGSTSASVRSLTTALPVYSTIDVESSSSHGATSVESHVQGNTTASARSLTTALPVQSTNDAESSSSIGTTSIGATSSEPPAQSSTSASARSLTTVVPVSSAIDTKNSASPSESRNQGSTAVPVHSTAPLFGGTSPKDQQTTTRTTTRMPTSQLETVVTAEELLEVTTTNPVSHETSSVGTVLNLTERASTSKRTSGVIVVTTAVALTTSVADVGEVPGTSLAQNRTTIDSTVVQSLGHTSSPVFPSSSLQVGSTTLSSTVQVSSDNTSDMSVQSTTPHAYRSIQDSTFDRRSTVASPTSFNNWDMQTTLYSTASTRVFSTVSDSPTKEYGKNASTTITVWSSIARNTSHFPYTLASTIMAETTRSSAIGHNFTSPSSSELVNSATITEALMSSPTEAGDTTAFALTTTENESSTTESTQKYLVTTRGRLTSAKVLTTQSQHGTTASRTESSIAASTHLDTSSHTIESNITVSTSAGSLFQVTSSIGAPIATDTASTLTSENTMGLSSTAPAQATATTAVTQSSTGSRRSGTTQLRVLTDQVNTTSLSRLSLTREDVTAQETTAMPASTKTLPGTRDVTRNWTAFSKQATVAASSSQSQTPINVGTTSSGSSTEEPQLSTSRPSRGDIIVLALCRHYPCPTASNNITASVLSWNEDAVISVTTRLESLPSIDLFEFSLIRMYEGQSPLVVWEYLSETSAISFDPLEVSDEVKNSEEQLELHVRASFVDGTIATGSMHNITFAKPPVIHSIQVVPASPSTTSLLQTFSVDVNATDQQGQELRFEYALDSATSDATFILSTDAPRSFTFEAPSVGSALYLKVRVTNTWLSFAECLLPAQSTLSAGTVCPLLELDANSSAISEQDAAVQILNLTSNLTLDDDQAGVLFLAGLNVVQNSDLSPNVTNSLLQDLLSNFVDYVASSDELAGTEVTDQNVALLAAFTESFESDNMDVNTTQSLLDGISAIGTALDSVHIPEETADLFLRTLDSAAGVIPPSNAVLDHLDSVVSDGCNALVAGEVPGYQSTTVGTYSTISCAVATPLSESDSILIDMPSGASLVATGATNESLIVSIAVWEEVSHDDGNLVSLPQTVHVEGDGDSATTSFNGDSNEGGYELILPSSNGDNSSSEAAFREQLQCSFWDGTRWSTMGMVLIGIDVEGTDGNSSIGIKTSVICLSSHLSLFAAVDESVFLDTVQEHFFALSDRVARLDNVDFADDDTQVSWPVPTLFAIVTVIFLLTIIISKLRARKTAAAYARRVFQRFGVLERPQVLGLHEVDAIVRGHTTARETWVLVALDVVIANPLLAPLFVWTHEAIVYNRSDKAFILYSQIMVSCIGMALFMDFGDDSDFVVTNGSQNGTSDSSSTTNEVVNTLVTIFVQAMFAQILLFPVKYLLPFMISNVNSIKSAAGDATKSVTAHIGTMLSVKRSAAKVAPLHLAQSQRASELTKGHARISTVVQFWKQVRWTV